MGASGSVQFDTQDVVSVGTDTGVVLPANPRRLYVALKNTSEQQVSLKLGADAVEGEGIILDPGEAFEMSELAGNLDVRVINGINDGVGAVNIARVEAIAVDPV